METKRFKNWWFLAINGIIFILFGCLLLFFTKELISTLVLYFGLLMLAGGGILLLTGINNIRKDKSAALIMVEAIAGIAIGLALILFPQPTAALFLMLIGIWAIIIGIIQLVVVVNIKRVLSGKNLLLINGLLTIALGIALLFDPFKWAEFMGKIIGFFSAFFGLILVYFSFVLLSVKNMEKNEPFADKTSS
jgi:uncharacterized membrane protein HdeD (DUF308 family)